MHIRFDRNNRLRRCWDSSPNLTTRRTRCGWAQKGSNVCDRLLACPAFTDRVKTNGNHVVGSVLVLETQKKIVHSFEWGLVVECDVTRKKWPVRANTRATNDELERRFSSFDTLRCMSSPNRPSGTSCTWSPRRHPLFLLWLLQLDQSYCSLMIFVLPVTQIRVPSQLRYVPVSRHDGKSPLNGWALSGRRGPLGVGGYPRSRRAHGYCGVGMNVPLSRGRIFNRTQSGPTAAEWLVHV